MFIMFLLGISITLNVILVILIYKLYKYFNSLLKSKSSFNSLFNSVDESFKDILN